MAINFKYENNYNRINAGLFDIYYDNIIRIVQLVYCAYDFYHINPVLINHS